MVYRKYVKTDVIMQIDKNLIKLQCLQWVEEKGLEKMDKVIDR